MSLFGMIMFQAWEIKKAEGLKPQLNKKIIPEIYFRHVEKIMLYLAKHIIQSIVLIIVKYYFIFSTKFKKWIGKNWPRVYYFFKKKEVMNTEIQKNSFFRKAVLESRVKIKKIKENVRREHEEKIATEEKN
jgi:hypothetical protein